jgi:hypothetical protein
MERDTQTPFDVAVVIQTILRPSLSRAVRSVFRQDLKGRIQVLVGIDKKQGHDSLLDELIQQCPSHIRITVVDLGYSTSRRHGGLYSTRYGGGLRTILSYAANSRFVAYLDDDDWWAHDHLSSLLAAIQGKDWAFSYRWIVDQPTGWPICRDEWDSVGTQPGINKDRFGGFVAPSTLMLEKEACHFVLPFWSLAAWDDATGEDRLVFAALLKDHSWVATGKYSSYYEMRPPEQLEPHHVAAFVSRKISWIVDRPQIDRIVRLSEEAAAALAVQAPEAAIEASRKALRLNPCHAASLYCLAIAEWQLGRCTAALLHSTPPRAAHDSDPAIANAWAAMTSALAAAGRQSVT